MKKISIIYGSTGGNTEIVCMKVASLLDTKGYEVEIKNIMNVMDHDFTSDLTILACPTYGNGVLEKNFSVIADLISKIDLSNKKYAIIGLGDFKYDIDYHYESIRILEKIVLNKKGVIICEPLRILKSPYRYMNKFIPNWVNNLTEKIDE